MALTPKQQRFVDEYMIDLDATKAAIRAGYSTKTARSIGSENLTKPDIQAAISLKINSQSYRCEIDADWVVKRLVREAEFFGEGASHSARVRAIELLGKRFDLFPDKHQHEHTGKDGGPIEHKHDVGITARIDQLTIAFEGVADRAGEGGPASDGAGEPVRPG